MWISDAWKDYELLDCSDGERLERWKDYILIRPDPQVIWDTPKKLRQWREFSARYIRSSSGGGRWDKRDLPERWSITYGDLSFGVKPMNFKHTGVFPEQAANWDYMRRLIEKAGRPVSVLNLFAYTGAATLACASAGASVCHVDAAKGMVAWGRENAALSNLDKKPIRWIVDDCAAFVEREIRRGRRYDAVIMDPPSYGRGPGGEIWRLEDDLYKFVNLVTGVLSDNPLFFIINSYTSGLSAPVLEYILGVTVKKRFGGSVIADDLALPVKNSGLFLPCGTTGRWTAAGI